MSAAERRNIRSLAVGIFTKLRQCKSDISLSHHSQCPEPYEDRDRSLVFCQLHPSNPHDIALRDEHQYLNVEQPDDHMKGESNVPSTSWGEMERTISKL